MTEMIIDCGLRSSGYDDEADEITRLVKENDYASVMAEAAKHVCTD